MFTELVKLEMFILALNLHPSNLPAKHHRIKKIQHINHTIIYKKKSPPEVNIALLPKDFFMIAFLKIIFFMIAFFQMVGS